MTINTNHSTTTSSSSATAAHLSPFSPRDPAVVATLPSTSSTITSMMHHHHHSTQKSNKKKPTTTTNSNNNNNTNHNNNPYSCIALSPPYAILATRDQLQLIQIMNQQQDDVSSSNHTTGLRLLQNLPVASQFQMSSSTTTTSTNTSTSSSSSARHHSLFFGSNSNNTKTPRLPGVVPKTTTTTTTTTSSPSYYFTITDVAWSNNSNSNHAETMIAAAATNGVIVVWKASELLGKTILPASITHAASTATTKQNANPPSTTNTTTKTTNRIISHHHPEGVVLCHHPNTVVSSSGGAPGQPRAVNRLAWHPTKQQLLSASQDGTVFLWEQQQQQNNTQPPPERKKTTLDSKRFSLFGGATGSGVPGNPGRPHDQGGMDSTTTRSGSHTNTTTAWRCRLTFEPKCEAVRDIQWSPFFEDIFALVTKSGSLVVYNMNVRVRAIVKKTVHSGDAVALDWHPTQPYIIATGGTDRCVKIWDLETELKMESSERFLQANAGTSNSYGESMDSVSGGSDTEPSGHPHNNDSSVSFSVNKSNTMQRNSVSSSGNLSTSRKGGDKSMIQVLAVSATVTRIRWRPPSGEMLANNRDRHDSMIAIATNPIKGASAGGNGFVSLWSYEKPNMPLSVVEGHTHGAVTDFHWLETPQGLKKKGGTKVTPTSSQMDQSWHGLSSKRGAYISDAVETMYYDLDEAIAPPSIWQHVLSVGRDGRCHVQSFVRGQMPFRRIPPTCFAMANLSPFQKGFGSLQVFSLTQPKPNGSREEFELTALRTDEITSMAPGIFKEKKVVPALEEKSEGKRAQIPLSPVISFNVIDQGDLHPDGAKPLGKPFEGVMIAPEVVHLSRFADQYRMYLDETNPTRASLCLHNAQVAKDLGQPALTHLWEMVANILSCSGHDDLPENLESCTNVIQFSILPTLKAILEERSESGDVQTCVVLCEIFSVVSRDQVVRVPGLELSLIREWYYSYIDLLRDMCLFSQAAFLISNAQDPFVGEINQQSTAIHEACPQCKKAILPGDSQIDNLDGDSLSRRTCRSCSTKVGRCFLCHEVVKDLFVWCSGCSHGGHIKCALAWFGGQENIREACPTGCGHRCNLSQQVRIFPRTESLRDTMGIIDLREDL